MNGRSVTWGTRMGFARLVTTTAVVLVVAGCGGADRTVAPAVTKTLGGMLAIGTDPVTGATIETDKDDYVPGEVVHLTGRGWEAGETVHLFMSEDPDTHGDVEQDVVADSNGEFSLHFYDVQEHDLGVTFTLTATGGTSGSKATALFTDGQPQSVTLNPTALTFNVGGDTKQSTISVSMVGNNSACTVTLSVTLPFPAIAGLSAQIVGGNPIALPNGSGNVSFSRTLSVATTNATPVGDFDVGVVASRGSNCQGNGVETASVRVSVTAPNQPPIANAGASYTGNEGNAIGPSGTASDPDNNPLTTTWSFASGSGTGCSIANASSLSTASVTCNDNGSHTLVLTVSDGIAPPVTAQATLTVANVAPTATFGTSPSAVLGTPFNINLNTPQDPSSADVSAGFTYDFDCGSGYTGTFGTAPSINCTVNTGTSVTVKGKIKDKDGGVTEYTAKVALNNQAPIANAGGPYSGNEGVAIALSGTGSDPDGGAAPTFAWSTNAPAGTCSISNATMSSASITCDDNGAWTVTLTVTDDEGASTPSTVAMEVANVAPTATFTDNGPVNEGSPINLSLTGAYDVASDLPGLEYAFDCGSGYGNFSSGATTVCPTIDNGTRSVKGTIRDKDGGSTEYTATVTINNVAPTATFGNNGPVDEGSPIELSLTNIVDVAADVPTLEFAFDCGQGYIVAATPAASCATTDNGTRTVKGKVTDKDGGSTEYTATVTIDNVAPTATFGHNGPVNEGSPILLSLTAPVDVPADLPTLVYAFDCGSGYGVYSTTATASCPTTDNGTRTVMGTVKDKDGGSTEYTATVTINNVAPSILTLAASNYGPVPVTATIGVSGTFSDPGSADSHTLALDCDGGAASGLSATHPDFAGTCTFANAGVYEVSVTVTDDDNGAASRTDTQYIVVYDPSAGFVTGGGWINSAAGACKAASCSTLSGKATFGFVSKYLKGATVPTGNTEFQFHAGGLNFKSTAYQWLVVNQNGSNAQFKGSGKINGAGSYTFMIWAIDGSPDTFRIQITDDNAAGAIVYDNGFDQAIAAGSIQIQTGGKK